MPVPVCLAMVVADSHYKDPFTSKHTLLGIFSTLGGSGFPLTHPHLSVYVALSDGHGRTPILLEMLDADEEREPVFKFEGHVDFEDPRNVIEMCFGTSVIQFPEPGEYRLKLFAGREFIMERKILVSLTPGPAS